MKIILARHGETKANLEYRYQGTIDWPLTKKGLGQVKLVAKLLSKEKLSAFYSSPMGRAIATSKKIAKFHEVKPVFRDELKEINYGEFDGKTLDEIDKKHPRWLIERHTNRYYAKPPGGENYVELEARLRPVVDEILGKKGTVLVVAHSNVNKAITRMVLGLPVGEMNFGKLYQPHTCVYFLEGSKKKGFELTYKLAGGEEKGKGYLKFAGDD